AGVWELHLHMNTEGADRILADSPLPERAVVLGLDLTPRRKAGRVAHSGRLRRLRQIDSGMTILIFGDARLAAGWLDSGATAPLMTKLRKFVDNMYRVDQSRKDIPELEKKLRSGELTEEKVSDTARSLLAAAFKGQPVPEGRP